MGYGRLQPSNPGGSSRHIIEQSPPHQQPAQPPKANKKKLFITLSLLSIALIIAAAVTSVILITGKSTSSSSGASSLLHRKPTTQAISNACSKTLFSSLCIDSLLDFPGSLNASESDLVHISFNMTLHHVSKALYLSSGLSYLQMGPHTKSAFQDCLELLDNSVDALTRALTTVAPGQQRDGSSYSRSSSSSADVVTWLSSALTNQDTCGEGLADVVDGTVREELGEKLKDLAELVSNCLAIFSATSSDDFSGVPIQNRRRLLKMERDVMGDDNADISRDFPRWVHYYINIFMP